LYVKALPPNAKHDVLDKSVLAIIFVTILVALALEEGSETCSDHSDDLAPQLLDWLRENGAYINEKVVARHLLPDDPLSPRGIFTTDDMDVGETVCRILWDLILKPSEVDLGTGETDCGAIEAVADAMSDGGKTPYGAYLLAQPKDYTSAFWSQVSERMSALQSTRYSLINSNVMMTVMCTLFS